MCAVHIRVPSFQTEYSTFLGLIGDENRHPRKVSGAVNCHTCEGLIDETFHDEESETLKQLEFELPAFLLW